MVLLLVCKYEPWLPGRCLILSAAHPAFFCLPVTFSEHDNLVEVFLLFLSICFFLFNSFSFDKASLFKVEILPQGVRLFI